MATTRSFIRSFKAVILTLIVAGSSFASNAHQLPNATSTLPSNHTGEGQPPIIQPPAWLRDPQEIPSGSVSRSLRVGKHGDEEVALFQTQDAKNEHIRHTYIVIHGELSDAWRYWPRMNNAIEKARQLSFPGANRNLMVVAPILFSNKYNCGQYADNQLAWNVSGAWQDGREAIHPPGTNVTSLDVMDKLVEEFSDHKKFPRMTNITIVGQSGGGQFVQRYAAVAKEPRSHGIHIRYIQVNPSSSLYFTQDRPNMMNTTLPSKRSCHKYNNWRYGFDQFPSTLNASKTPEEYFRQFISRDVISLVGYQDTDLKGGQTCMDRMQGGPKRRDRNLIWYQYINGLARTGEDLQGFPGKFDDLPDWSSVSNHSIKTRLMVLENANHEFINVFATDGGRSALFSDRDLLPSWRPGQPSSPCTEN
ncbi:hypothetical protein PT974_04355 [Cladobotryum mycophilum]|uniref:Transmembrane protein n=1 Tax=Cladobotryum mycophilum TaxID=491253 RepID=A0ABR0SUU1_9HYPO